MHFEHYNFAQLKSLAIVYHLHCEEPGFEYRKEQKPLCIICFCQLASNGPKEMNVFAL